MDINTNSRFAINPTAIEIQRSKFDRSSRHKTTFNAGRLVPLYVDEALPGDTFQMDMAHVIRMSTSIHPTMDNSYFEIFAFSVPFRLVWEHWKEFNGENTTSAWEQTTEYEIPQITSPAETGWTKGTLADHMGLPTGIPGLSVSALPFRAYTLIVNEWFRDQNLQDPAYISLDETTQAGVNTDNYVTDLEKGGMPFRVAKYHDYFTSALPEPQKGPDVLLPLGSVAEVYAGSKVNSFTGSDRDYASLAWRTPSGSIPSPNKANLIMNNGLTYSTTQDVSSVAPNQGVMPANLYADLRNADGANINDLFQAIALQKLYLNDARGGTRYIEVIKSHFGVTSPDARQQRPEFLGGIKTPLNVDQVLQTSGTESNGTQTTPQGNVAGFTHSSNRDSLFTKSFTEHEIIMVLGVVRTLHTYQQGINRMWSRKKRFDFYWPALANIGEQAILNKEIYAQGNSEDEEGFGYQEAWADYRYKPSIITGELRSTYAQSLDSWHYGDDYNSLPVLGPEWIQETSVNIDRTLAVQSSLADQFILDCAFKLDCTRPMPVYSIPGIQTL